MAFRTKWILPLLVLAAFLPYLSKERGVRVENLAGLVLAIWATFVILHRGRVTATVLPMILVSTVLLLHVTSSTFLAPGGLVEIKRGLGRLDHYFRPVAILLICEACLFRADREAIESTFLRCVNLLFICVVVNTALQFATVFMDIDPYVQAFRPSSERLGFTVADAAAGNARFVGIFNQPGEQGAVYATALVVWVLVWKRRLIGTAWAAVTLFAIIAGGALGISKVFLVGGLAVAIVLALSLGIHFRDVRLGVLILGLVAAITAWIVTYWKGAVTILGFYSRLINPTTMLYAVSGGRFGGEASLAQEYLIVEVSGAFRQSPLFGVGAAGAQGFFDNEYLMALGEGGLVGLAFVLARAAVVMNAALPYVGRDLHARGLMAMGALLAGGSMGGPIGGIPRCGTIIWVFIGLLLFLQPQRAAAPRPARAGALDPLPA